MKRTLTIACGILAASLLFSAAADAAIVDVGTSGVYDEQVNQTNAVDDEKTSDGGEYVSLATLKTDVLAAWSANLGGVIHFDDVDTSGGKVSVADGLRVTYGISGTRTLDITIGGEVAADGGVVMPGTTTPISSGQALYMGGAQVANNYFTPFFFDAADKVVEVAFTFTSQASKSFDGMRAFVCYDDTTRSSNDLTEYSVAAGNGLHDTFWGFKAPDGKVVTRLVIRVAPSSGSLGTSCIDDLAFVTVPEPATMGLLGLGFAGMAALRRRRGRA